MLNLNTILDRLRTATEQQLACFEQLVSLPEMELLNKVADMQDFREKIKALRASKAAEIALLDQVLTGP
jgi:hypothetical protein